MDCSGRTFSYGIATHAGYAMSKRTAANATVRVRHKVYCENMKFIEDAWEVPQSAAEVAATSRSGDGT